MDVACLVNVNLESRVIPSVLMLELMGIIKLSGSVIEFKLFNNLSWKDVPSLIKSVLELMS